MADIRINSLPSTATSFNTDDYIAIDGASGGTRKMLAANPPFSDVTLGTSGPSVKSSLSARAPRQGLVFDGTTGSSGTLGSIPSGTWTVSAVIDVPTSNPAANLMALTMGIGYGVAGGGSFVLGDINTSGSLTISQWAGTFPAYREATISGFRAAYSGKRVHLAAVVTGAALTVYINGVATSYTEASGAGAPAWGATLGSANVFVGKGQSALYYFSGGIYAPLIYNRALSASEVVALYEAGAPAGADYQYTGTSNWLPDSISGGALSFGSANTTSFSINNTSGSTVYLNLYKSGTASRVGQKFRVAITITTLTGGTVSLGWQNNTITPVTIEGTESNDVTLIATPSSTSGPFIAIPSGVNVVATYTITPIGLLLAPDAAQAGGGLVWYDTSGNAANITLPASGVSWNVPTSGRWGGSLTVAAGGNASLKFAGASNVGTLSFLDGASTSAQTAVVETYSFQVKTNGTSALTIGATQDATFTGYVLNRVNAKGIYTGTSDNCGFTWTGTNGEFSTASGSIILKSAGTTALTLDSSQNATFAGTVTASKAGTAFYSIESTVNGAISEVIVKGKNSTGTAREARLGLNKYADDVFSIYDGTTERFRLGLTNGDATFAGKVTPTGGIVGVTTNSNAAAGIVGQYVEAQVASGSAITLSTATAANITSISLTAGDWDVSSNCIFIPAGAPTLNLVAVGQTSSSATLPADVYRTQLSQPGNGFNSHLPVTTTRFSLASTTTIYLVAYAEFSGGTSLKAHGIISARRVR